MLSSGMPCGSFPVLFQGMWLQCGTNHQQHPGTAPRGPGGAWRSELRRPGGTSMIPIPSRRNCKGASPALPGPLRVTVMMKAAPQGAAGTLEMTFPAG